MDDFNNDVLFKSDLKNEVDFFLPLVDEKLNTPAFRSIKLKRKSEIRIIQLITRRNNPQNLLTSEHAKERYSLKFNQYKSILKTDIDSSEVDKYCLELACTCHIKAAISISNLILEHNQQSHWKTWLDWNSHENQISHWQTKLFTSPTINNEKDIRNYFNLYGAASKLVTQSRLQNPKKAQNQMGLKTPIWVIPPKKAST